MPPNAATLRRRFLDTLPPDERAAEVTRARKEADHIRVSAWQAPRGPRKKLGASQIGVGMYSGAFAGAEPRKPPIRVRKSKD
jgi:hypothetical protein